MNDLHRRLDVIEARIAISELRSRYCWYATRGMRDETLTLFTDDCFFENHRTAGGTPVSARGKPALREFMGWMRPASRVPLVTNEVTQVNGDTAEGSCVMQSVGDDGFCGHYVDAFLKLGGVWLFSSRRYFPYWPVYNPSPDRRAP
jgi:hypothetical protein